METKFEKNKTNLCLAFNACADKLSSVLGVKNVVISVETDSFIASFQFNEKSS